MDARDVERVAGTCTCRSGGSRELSGQELAGFRRSTNKGGMSFAGAATPGKGKNLRGFRHSYKGQQPSRLPPLPQKATALRLGRLRRREMHRRSHEGQKQGDSQQGFAAWAAPTKGKGEGDSQQGFAARAAPTKNASAPGIQTNAGLKSLRK
jgi:hypothetical protein